MQEALRKDDVYFGKDIVPSCLSPHFVPHRTYDRWIQHGESISMLLQAMGELIFREKDLLDQFRLPEAAKALLAIDPGYERLSVICRPDCVWNGDEFHILEVNSDSPAMMTFVDYLEALTCRLFANELRNWSPPNRTKRLYETLLGCYRERGGTSEHPTIAIVDWNDVMTQHEQRRTALEFGTFGSECFTCDPRELSIQGGRLLGKGRPIDLVYRRVLFMDFLRRPDELRPMLEAYRSGIVCMANPLRSFVLGNKLLLALSTLR